MQEKLLLRSYIQQTNATLEVSLLKVFFAEENFVQFQLTVPSSEIAPSASASACAPHVPRLSDNPSRSGPYRDSVWPPNFTRELLLFSANEFGREKIQSVDPFHQAYGLWDRLHYNYFKLCFATSTTTMPSSLPCRALYISIKGQTNHP